MVHGFWKNGSFLPGRMVHFFQEKWFISSRKMVHLSSGKMVLGFWKNGPRFPENGLFGRGKMLLQGLEHDLSPFGRLSDSLPEKWSMVSGKWSMVHGEMVHFFQEMVQFFQENGSFLPGKWYDHL